MKFQLLAASVAALSLVVSAEEALEPRALPLVQSVRASIFPSYMRYLQAELTSLQNQLRRVLLRSELLAKARTLEGFAYATPQRNRQIFTPGHKATYEWLYESIKKGGRAIQSRGGERAIQSGRGGGNPIKPRLMKMRRR